LAKNDFLKLESSIGCAERSEAHRSLFLRILPRFKSLTVEMVSRMNQDMIFDHAEAAQDLGFKLRAFFK
jgi:hypothetical protein